MCLGYTTEKPSLTLTCSTALGTKGFKILLQFSNAKPSRNISGNNLLDFILLLIETEKTST